MSEATTAEAVAAAPAANSGNKKLIVIILVAVLLAAAAAGGAAWFFTSRSSEHGEQKAGGKNAGKAEAEKKKPSGPAIYYKIDPALVVNFQSNGVTRFLQVALEVSTRNPAVAEELKQHDPVIRNDLLMLLGSQNETTVISREGKEKLRAEALEAVRNVVTNEGGKGSEIENVYFTSFVMQ